MDGKKKTLALLIAGLVGSSSAAAEDLIDIYEMAYSSDPALLAAKARFESTAEGKRQAFANFLPQITGTGSITEGDSTFSINGMEVSDTDTDNENLRLEVRQTIYDHGNYKQLDQSRARAEQAQADYDAALQDFVLRGAERYFAVLTAEDALAFAMAEERAVGRQLEQAEQRYEVGLTAITDVHESKARYDNARARVIVAENNLSDAKEALQELTNVYVDKLDPVQEELPSEIPEPNDLNAWVDIAVENSPALRSARLGVDVAHMGVALSKSEFYPTVGATLSYNEFTNNQFILRDDFQNVIGTTDAVAEDVQIQLAVTVPIYTGGRTSSRVRQAVADLEAAQQTYEEQRRAVIRQARNAFRGTQASILEVEAREQAVISAQSALEATEAGFEVGTRTIVDVLLSQQQLFQAQRDYSQARHDYILNRLRLKEAAGTLTRDDIAAINQLLVEAGSADSE